MIIEGMRAVLTSPTCLLWILAGVFVGIVFGSIPGLSAAMAMVLFLPITFGMESVTGIATLIALYIGGISGGLISAILLKIPGTPASISTVFDGGPMADRGEAGRAIGVGILYSFFGGLLSIAALIFIAPWLANFALKFTSFEYFSIAILSLTIIARLSEGSMINSLISGLLGVLISFIGMSPLGMLRFTFGNRYLMSGVSTVPLLIGLFAVGEIFKFSFTDKNKSLGEKKPYQLKGFGISTKEFIEQLPNMIRSSILGIFIGILPGLGGSTAGLLAYSSAKSASKYPEKFGTGIIDGVIASEAANNANIGGSLVPLLTLGIPGNTCAALLLSGLTIHKITPGPLIFENSGVYVYAIFTALIIANIFMLIIERAGIRVFVKLLDIPKYILFPIIIELCMVGAFADNNRPFDVLLIFIFGISVFLLKKLGLQSTPFIIGYILGPIAETNLVRAMSQSDGSILPFFTRPISCVFLVITLLTIVSIIVKNMRSKPGEIREVLEDED